MSTAFPVLVDLLTATRTAARPLTTARLLPTTVAIAALRVRIIGARMGRV